MLQAGSLTDESIINDLSWNQLTSINERWFYKIVRSILSKLHCCLSWAVVCYQLLTARIFIWRKWLVRVDYVQLPDILAKKLLSCTVSRKIYPERRLGSPDMTKPIIREYKIVLLMGFPSPVSLKQCFVTLLHTQIWQRIMTAHHKISPHEKGGENVRDHKNIPTYESWGKR
jgi:hypothetical protein